MKFADLHLHTLFSDGTYSAQELIAQATRHGLSAIAVVDHDTVGGIESAANAAEGKGIEVLPGIELTSEYDGLEIHILGYLIDYKRADLLERLDFLRNNRIERVYKIVARLEDMGVRLDVQSIFDLAKNGSVGRLHVARAMLKEGLVDSVQEAFRRYIGDKCPAYIAGFRFSPQEAIEVIKDTGGIPVLAHPYILGRDDLIPQFVNCGLMGLEVYYPEHSQSMVNFYLDIAKKFNLLVTGGSDCHGYAKAEIQIGSVKIPYALVDKLKQAKGI